MVINDEDILNHYQKDETTFRERNYIKIGQIFKTLTSLIGDNIEALCDDLDSGRNSI